jgi:hypothetical protein
MYDAIKETANWFARNSGYSKGSSEYDEFVKKMEELLNKPYESVTPDKPNAPQYTEMGTDDRTNQQLSDLARQQLEEYRQQQQNAINNKKESEEQALNSNRDTAEQLLKDRQQQIEGSYEQASDSLNNDLLKRGLARSSIAANSNAKLETSKLDAINQNQAQYTQQLQDIQAQLSQLEAQRLQALDQFDISYAAKLTTTINELVQARDKTNADAIKYNNSIQQQIRDDYSNSLSDREKEISLNQTAQDRELQARQQEMFKQARQVLANMSPKEARAKLEKDPIFKNLPTHMHTALFREFVR